ncbi:hypothetical protein PRIPAC_77998 [Pristionchus pacificus]|uniref:G protein-coupled receptor n=1 Tax=Pristionchus pacificus TaxID=54126 RepID=A0A2A6CLY2_PRIPA|nr:hypothetical protein PRIPAC_77998 [Pristionchus pacificus]|eukprot:PDM79041.1 G protein-coupled receptor [Pristionchus pacificus]
MFHLIRKAEKLDSFRYVFFAHCIADSIFAIVNSISLMYWAHLPKVLLFFPTGPLAYMSLLTPIAFQLQSLSYIFIMCLVCTTFLHRFQVVNRMSPLSQLRTRIINVLVYVPVIQWIITCDILMRPNGQLRDKANALLSSKYQLDFEILYLIGVDISDLTSVNPLLIISTISILMEMTTLFAGIIWCGFRIHRFIESSMINLVLALCFALYPVSNPILNLLLSKELTGALLELLHIGFRAKSQTNMRNPWIEIARVLIPLEGAAGMVLNLVLLYYLARTNIGQAARLYYYSCIVTAILAFYTAFGIFITVDSSVELPAIIDGSMMAIFYGQLLFLFPKWLNDFICIAFIAQLIPAPSILQWLALSNIERGNRTKMLFAYSVPVAFNVLAWALMPGFIPSDEYRLEIAASVTRLYGTTLNDFHIFGVRLRDEARIDALDLALYDVIPSFLVSYALFALSAFKIRTKLVDLGASVSRRTKQLQLRFLLTQIAQVFLPFVLTSIPLGAMCIASIMGAELHNWPVLVAIMMWPMPMGTALLTLGFVRKAETNRTTPRNSNQSQSLQSARWCIKNGRGNPSCSSDSKDRREEMSNRWIEVARILIPMEGIAGMILNLLLIIILARTSIGHAARLYYYSCIITAILSLYTAFGIFITIDLPAIIDGNLVAMFYGPALFYFPEWITNVICIVFVVQVHTMWQLMMPGVIPSEDLRVGLVASAQRVFGTNLSDFHAIGFRISDKNHLDGIDVALFDIIPSFLVCYALFGIGAFKIRSKLVSLGASTSKRTKQMQLRFFLTQIAQVLLPLILTSIPLGVYCVAAIMGQELHNFPVLIAIILWSMPMLTALVYLGFVRKTAIKQTQEQPRMSFSLSKFDKGQLRVEWEIISRFKRTRPMQHRFFLRLYKLMGQLRCNTATYSQVNSIWFAALIGQKLHNFPVLIAIILWPMPMITTFYHCNREKRGVFYQSMPPEMDRLGQESDGSALKSWKLALLILGFVHKSAMNRTPQQSTSSLSKYSCLGAVGMILNILLIFYLVRTNIGQAAQLYYYSCIVTAILSCYTSFGIFITVDLPAIIDGKLMGIFYGSLLFYFPQWMNNIICVAFFAQVHTMWQVSRTVDDVSTEEQEQFRFFQLHPFCSGLRCQSQMISTVKKSYIFFQGLKVEISQNCYSPTHCRYSSTSLLGYLQIICIMNYF